MYRSSIGTHSEASGGDDDSKTTEKLLKATMDMLKTQVSDEQPKLLGVPLPTQVLSTTASVTAFYATAYSAAQETGLV